MFHIDSDTIDEDLDDSEDKVSTNPKKKDTVANATEFSRNINW